jgi:hypothetical protein
MPFNLATIMVASNMSLFSVESPTRSPVLIGHDGISGDGMYFELAVAAYAQLTPRPQ